MHFSKKYKGYENALEKWRLKKWEKIEEKPPENHANSLKTTDNNANSYFIYLFIYLFFILIQ